MAADNNHIESKPSINLFEYQNKEDFPLENREALEEHLEKIWQDRDRNGAFALYSSFGTKGEADDEGEREKNSDQPFVTFHRKKKQGSQATSECISIKSANYIGIISFQGKNQTAQEIQHINLLPKIFYEEGRTPSTSANTPQEITAIQYHILWWLSYCRGIRFPRFSSAVSAQRGNFLELLIYCFALYTRELFSHTLYQYYEEVNEELPYIKGRIDTSAYIQQNLARGRWHRIHCTYDSFVVDNRFNQIVKRVAVILHQWSRNAENKRMLQEIIFILADVSDRPARSEDCRAVQFNPLMQNFSTVRDYCQLFLDNSLTYHYKNDLRLFAFLLPMERVFEEFVFGFIDTHKAKIIGADVDVKAQVAKYLVTRVEDVDGSAQNKTIFKIRPDLILGRNILADTKYKMIDLEPANSKGSSKANSKSSAQGNEKRGISQADLYQMLAYTIRFNINKVILMYPMTLKQNRLHAQGETQSEPDPKPQMYTLCIENEFATAGAGTTAGAGMETAAGAEAETAAGSEAVAGETNARARTGKSKDKYIRIQACTLPIINCEILGTRRNNEAEPSNGAEPNSAETSPSKMSKPISEIFRTTEKTLCKYIKQIIKNLSEG